MWYVRALNNYYFYENASVWVFVLYGVEVAEEMFLQLIFITTNHRLR